MRACGAGERCFKGVVRVQVGNGEQGAGADAVEEAGLVGLDFARLQRRAAVADDGAGTVFLPVAEPLPQHVLARNFGVPHGRRHALDVALAHQKPLAGRVVVDRLG